MAVLAIAMMFGRGIVPAGPIGASEAQVVLAALFADVAVGIQLGVFDAWFRTAGRYPTAASLRQMTRLAEYAFLLTAVLFGATPGEAAVAFLLGGVAGVSVSWLALRRIVPWSVFKLEWPEIATARRLFGPGIAFAAFPVGNAVSVQGFTIAIGATLGTTAVVLFSTTRTLTRVALQAMASINAAIAPELSRAVGGEHFAEAKAILCRGVQLSVVVASGIVGVVAIFGEQAITFWTRDLVPPDILLLNTLLLVMLANSVWYTLSAALIATNHHARLAALYLAGTLFALVASVPLSRVHGLAGAASALLVIDIALTVYVFRASARLLGDTPSRLLRCVLDPSRDPSA
jgi:O-antigen/teichoic acid export membrane protein